MLKGQVVKKASKFMVLVGVVSLIVVNQGYRTDKRVEKHIKEYNSLKINNEEIVEDYGKVLNYVNEPKTFKAFKEEFKLSEKELKGLAPVVGRQGYEVVFKKLKEQQIVIDTLESHKEEVNQENYNYLKVLHQEDYDKLTKINAENIEVYSKKVERNHKAVVVLATLLVIMSLYDIKKGIPKKEKVKKESEKGLALIKREETI